MGLLFSPKKENVQLHDPVDKQPAGYTAALPFSTIRVLLLLICEVLNLVLN